jgi:hypothetical protein
MACKQIDFRYERLKLNIRKRLYDFGKMPEAQVRNYFRDHYDPEQVTKALDELCGQGFCERIITPRGASIVSLSTIQDDAQARVQETKA